jgi:hydantoinase/carbamoylase family amidase
VALHVFHLRLGRRPLRRIDDGERNPEVRSSTARRYLSPCRALHRRRSARPFSNQGELNMETHFGTQIILLAEQLAGHSDDEDCLTVAYLTRAHQTAGAEIAGWMIEAGMQVRIDAVGNVIGRYPAPDADAPVLMAGSHFDTVRDGGRYDGRLGILAPIVAVKHLHACGERLPFHLDVVAFAEEEGLRFHTSFLASTALVREFDFARLDQRDAGGVTLREAMIAAGLPGTEEAIAACAVDGARLLGFVELHIEQGPVLLDRGLPLGAVTSIAGSVRKRITVTGVASHAGTTPMPMRRDALVAAAEMVLAVERRCADPRHASLALVGTVGTIGVPQGASNVVPGRCEFSLDVRAADDAARDVALADLEGEFARIARERGVGLEMTETMRVPCARCSPPLRQRLADCIEAAGVPALHLPSGAGHDAMVMARITDVCMLFVRCGNGGISHNPLETLAAADADIAARVLLDFLRRTAATIGG